MSLQLSLGCTSGLLLPSSCLPHFQPAPVSCFHWHWIPSAAGSLPSGSRNCETTAHQAVRLHGQEETDVLGLMFGTCQFLSHKE